jgi:hypothetical protein
MRSAVRHTQPTPAQPEAPSCASHPTTALPGTPIIQCNAPTTADILPSKDLSCTGKGRGAQGHRPLVPHAFSSLEQSRQRPGKPLNRSPGVHNLITHLPCQTRQSFSAVHHPPQTPCPRVIYHSLQTCPAQPHHTIEQSDNNRTLTHMQLTESIATPAHTVASSISCLLQQLSKPVTPLQLFTPSAQTYC